MSSPQKVKHLRSEAVFAPVIDFYEIPDAERLNAELVEAIAGWRDEDPGIKRSNFAGWHSDGNIFKRTEGCMSEICRHFVEACKPPLTRHLTKEQVMARKLQMEGWVNVNGPHAYNQIHTHDKFELSGVYFVKVPTPSHKLSGALQFMNPSYRTGPYSDLFEKMNPQVYTVTPKEGAMLIFPSTMPHWVLPNDEDSERISIAFNVRLK